MDTKGLVSFDGNCAGYIRPLGDDQPAIARVYALADLHRFVACWNALAGLNPDAVADVVAALEACHSTLEHTRAFMLQQHGTTNPAREEALALARTALARIRGEG